MRAKAQPPYHRFDRKYLVILSPPPLPCRYSAASQYLPAKVTNNCASSPAAGKESDNGGALPSLLRQSPINAITSFRAGRKADKSLPSVGAPRWVAIFTEIWYNHACRRRHRCGLALQRLKGKGICRANGAGVIPAGPHQAAAQYIIALKRRQIARAEHPQRHNRCC